jgi:uncharacterized protein YbcI
MSDASIAASPELPAERREFSPSVAISNKMVRLMAAYIGRGPTRARTTLGTDLVIVTFADTMTRAEINMVAADKPEVVLSMRQVLNARMREEAIAAVEEVVGRKVIAYMSDIDTDADMAITAFVLESTTPSRT